MGLQWRGNGVCRGGGMAYVLGPQWEGGNSICPGSTVGGGIAYVQGPQYGRGREWRMFLGPQWEGE